PLIKTSGSYRFPPGSPLEAEGRPPELPPPEASRFAPVRPFLFRGSHEIAADSTESDGALKKAGARCAPAFSRGSPIASAVGRGRVGVVDERHVALEGGADLAPSGRPEDEERDAEGDGGEGDEPRTRPARV